MGGQDESEKDLSLGRFYGYLRLLARQHIDSAWRCKVDPSDIVQETLLDAQRAQGQFRGQGDGALATWLRQILARNLAHATRDLRRQKRDVNREVSLQAALDASSSRLEAWLAAEQSSPSQRADRNEQLLRLAQALDTLPELQRQAVILHYWHGRSLDDIGRQLERSQAAVAGLLYRGLKELRSVLRAAE